MVSEVEAVALRLFDARGVPNVTVEDIAASAGISVRTFYRYFPTKEDVLQADVRRRAEFLRSGLAARPGDESPLRSLLAVLEEEIAGEDTERRARWIRVISANPTVLAGVMGALQLHTMAVIREFFAGRLGLPEDSLAPWIWAAAAGGVMQGANIRWHLTGGDLAQIMSEGFELLEQGIPTRRRDDTDDDRPRPRRGRDHSGRL